MASSPIDIRDNHNFAKPSTRPLHWVGSTLAGPLARDGQRAKCHRTLHFGDLSEFVETIGTPGRDDCKEMERAPRAITGGGGDGIELDAAADNQAHGYPSEHPHWGGQDCRQKSAPKGLSAAPSWERKKKRSRTFVCDFCTQHLVTS